MEPDKKQTAKNGRAMREPQESTVRRLNNDGTRSTVKVVFDAAYNAADAMAAQRAAGKEASRFPLYLIQRIATFDGAQWTAQQIEEEIAGMDYLTLQGLVLGGDDTPGKS